MGDTPSPIERILGTFNAFHRTAALRAAVELDLFTHVLAGTGTPDALAAKTGASSRGIRILCDALAVMGFLEHGGGYRVPPDHAPFLDAGSPLFLGLVMLAMTSGGDVYGFTEYARMLDRAGFGAPTMHDLMPSIQRAIVATR